MLSLKEAEGQPEERTTSFEYDATFNRVKKITDPALKVTTIDIDPANGNVKKITNPLSDDRVFTYETTPPLTGLVKTVTDENGHVTTFDYDANGNIEFITDPEQHVTKFVQDSAGNILSITEGLNTPEVRTRTFTYDDHNRLTSATDGTANPPAQFRYDEQGNLKETELPTGEIRQRMYDEANRVIEIVDPRQGTSTFAYDFNGNLKTSTNALNDTTTFEYDGVNQLTKITDALMGEQTFAYDVAGNVEMFTDARSKTTTFDYDLLNRQILRINPLNQSTVFTYDTRSNLKTSTNPKNQLIDRDYDELSRLKTITTPDNTINVTYDAASNPLTVGDADSLVTFTYDGVNRVKTEGTADLGVQPAVTLTSNYNAVGNRITLTDILSSITSYEYDLAGRLTKLTMPALMDILLAYDPAGRLDTIIFPNGVVSDYGYDTQGRLNSLTHTLGANPSFTDFGYTYNPVGNIQSIIDNVTSAQTRTFTYDALQRLKTGGTTATPEDYDYDLTGNRTTSFLSTLHSHDDANRLLEDDDFTYTYDNNGNLATKTNKTTSAVTTYTWDAQDQLIQITFPDTTTAIYKYDGLGRRMEKNVNGTITRYVYDGEDMALEYDGTNTFLSRYSHGDQVDQPLAVQRAGVGFFYYHADHQGSVTHLTDSSGLIANTYLYDSYGRTLTLSETIPQPYTYTGREFDPESGLYYYRARYYDANTGRFLSEDPIGFNGGDDNFYRYVSNNPINFIDPLGLLNILGGAGGSAVGGTGVDVSGGVAVNIDFILDPSPGAGPETAAFLSEGAGGGVNVSGDVFVGFIEGSISDVAGTTANLNLVGGPFSVTIFLDPITGEIIGGTAGAGPTATPFGVSGTISNTGTVPLEGGRGGDGPC